MSDSLSFQIKSERAALWPSLWAQLDAGSSFQPLSRQASDAMDQWMVRAWSSLSWPDGCALFATGGYGRAQLWPGSDLDLFVLLPESLSESEQELLQSSLGAFSALLWDAGLEPGLSSRSASQALAFSEQDATIASTLLERRLLAGHSTAENRLRETLARLDPLTFFLAKEREQSDRRSLRGDSAYCLEPHVKEAAGGLRDLQTPLWVARLMGIDPSWEGLVRAGLLTGGEAELAAACEERLGLIRARMHLLCGRREDALSFELQHRMAERLGIGAEAGRSSSELLMDGYFSAARHAVMLNEVLMSALRERLEESSFGSPPARDLDEHFQALGDRLEIKDDRLFSTRPGALLSAFEWMLRDRSLSRMGSRTTRALWRASRRVDAWFRADQSHRAAFLRILQADRAVFTELDRMSRVGLLGAYIPAFGKAETLMQHDLFHAYTVGAHTLRLVRNLRHLSLPSHQHELPSLSLLMSRFDRPWLLLIAGLFHDIAKGRGGSHEIKGMEDARAFCESHGLAAEDTELCVWLVGAHLEMSKISQKQDIQDPQVIDSFSAYCGSQRKLDALYLLTVCDMRATSSKVFTPWKAGLLEQLYLAASSRLDSGVSARPSDRTSQAKRAARHAAEQAGSLASFQSFSREVDDSYWLGSAQSASWHAVTLAALPKTDRQRAQAWARPIESGVGFEIALLARDEPRLFERLCAQLARRGFSIQSARLFSLRSGWALDSLEALDLWGRDSQEALEELSSRLGDHLRQEAPSSSTPSLGKLSARAKSAGRVHVWLKPDSASRWLLEIHAPDRSGLLWAIADELASRGANMISARISTLGEKAEDVFLIEGASLERSQDRQALAQALERRLSSGLSDQPSV